MISPIKQRRKHTPQHAHQPSGSIPNEAIEEQRPAHHTGNKIMKKMFRFPSIILAVLLLICMAYQFNTDSSLHREETQTFSSLQRDSVLIGQYTLDKDYRYWPLQNPKRLNDASVTGIIYFPAVDLTNLIDEDATNSELRVRLLTNNTSDLYGDIIPSMDHQVEESHALLTLKGFKGETPNQDRSMIARFFTNENNTIQSATSDDKDMENGYGQKEALFMGIFDGHGERGHEVSQHVALELPKIFTRTIKQHQQKAKALDFSSSSNYDQMLRKVFQSTFLEVDNTEPVKGSGASGGSTASTIFYPGWGSKLYLANVGDSITTIAHYSKSSKQSTIVKQNRKDKPHLVDERKRIEASGGHVYLPTIRMSSEYGPKDSSRLLITLPGGFQLGLAMSRSIGDADGKAFGLIAEPTVEVFDINEYYTQQKFTSEQIEDSEWFAVIASDGVYDVIPPEQVIQRLGESLYMAKASVGSVCEQLIREAGRLWITAMKTQPYRDDITLGVSKIDV